MLDVNGQRITEPAIHMSYLSFVVQSVANMAYTCRINTTLGSKNETIFVSSIENQLTTVQSIASSLSITQIPSGNVVSTSGLAVSIALTKRASSSMLIGETHSARNTQSTTSQSSDYKQPDTKETRTTSQVEVTLATESADSSPPPISTTSGQTITFIIAGGTAAVLVLFLIMCMFMYCAFATVQR